MLDFFEVTQGLVEVPEERLQNFRPGRLRARNTIPEQARHAVAGLEERVLQPQPRDHLALDLLHGDVAEPGTAGTAGGVTFRDERPAA